MASLQKTYFLAPSWNIRPGDVTLGSILVNPRFPQRVLVPAIPHRAIDSALATPQLETACSGTAKKEAKWSVGLFATFLQFAVVGGEVSFTNESLLQVDYACDAMKTCRFNPTMEYIARSVNQSLVRAFLKSGGFRAKVYMVTGIKVVSNVTITTTEEKKRETVTKLVVDVPAVQVRVGPKISHNSSGASQHARTIAEPIVFAFEVETLRVNHKGNAVHKQHIDGAMLGKDESGNDDEVVERAGPSLDDDEIEDLDLMVRAGVEDQTDSVCDIFVPLTHSST